MVDSMTQNNTKMSNDKPFNEDTKGPKDKPADAKRDSAMQSEYNQFMFQGQYSSSANMNENAYSKIPYNMDSSQMEMNSFNHLQLQNNNMPYLPMNMPYPGFISSSQPQNQSSSQAQDPRMQYNSIPQNQAPHYNTSYQSYKQENLNDMQNNPNSSKGVYHNPQMTNNSDFKGSVHPQFNKSMHDSPYHNVGITNQPPHNINMGINTPNNEVNREYYNQGHQYPSYNEDMINSKNLPFHIKNKIMTNMSSRPSTNGRNTPYYQPSQDLKKDSDYDENRGNIPRSDVKAPGSARQINRGGNWQYIETKIFLDKLRQYQKELSNLREHPYIWKEISYKLSFEGYQRPVKACKNRWKVLVAKYKKCQEKRSARLALTINGDKLGNPMASNQPHSISGNLDPNMPNNELLYQPPRSFPAEEFDFYNDIHTILSATQVSSPK